MVTGATVETAVPMAATVAEGGMAATETEVQRQAQMGATAVTAAMPPMAMAAMGEQVVMGPDPTAMVAMVVMVEPGVRTTDTREETVAMVATEGCRMVPAAMAAMAEPVTPVATAAAVETVVTAAAAVKAMGQ